MYGFLNSFWLTVVLHVACYPYYKCYLLRLFDVWVPYLLNLLSSNLYRSGSLVWYSVYKMQVVLSSKFLKQGCTHFPKLLELCQNCGCQKGNIQQDAYCRPADIGYRHRKFSHLGFVHLCSKVSHFFFSFCQYFLFCFPIIVIVTCCVMTASCYSYVALLIDGWSSMVHWWKDTDRKTKVLREKPVPVPLHPPQIACGLKDWPVQWGDSKWPPALQQT
jgi:hypothetical protein